MLKKAFILIMVMAIGTIVLFIREIQVSYVGIEKSIIFRVEEGDGLLEISNNLEKEGVVKNSHIFALYMFVSGKRTGIKAGTYLFSEPKSVLQVADKLFYGNVYYKRVTVIEGWNLNDIAVYLEREGLGTKEEFYKLAGRPPFFEGGEVFQGHPGNLDNSFEFLLSKPEDVTLEGFLFPDTYHIPFDAGMEEAIKVILNNFKRKFPFDLIEESDMSFFEILTLASLIEKEVIIPEDKAIVSGIIRERMRIEMPVQIDATVVYLTGKRTTRVSVAETRIDSLYNTYVYKGLPKGPISNPGLSSIEAAINPQTSDYLYYLSKPTGETVFSRTLEEHNIAKNKYLK